MTYRIPLREAQRRFQARQPFNCNDTLTGRPTSRAYPSGMLTTRWVAYLNQFGREVVYVVKSYDTPVAWVMRDGRVIVPDVRYSQTTSRHIRALGVRYTPEPRLAVAA